MGSRDDTEARDLFPDRVWLAPVGLAGLATLLTAHDLALVAPLLVVGLVPWAAVVLGRRPPTWALTALGLGSPTVITLLDGQNGSIFLATTTLCLLATTADRAWQLGLLASAGVVIPLSSALAPHPFDLGAFYFAIGDLFGIAVGMLVGHTRRLDERLRRADALVAASVAQEERTRLARDVHDLVAHSLTVVVLQISGARSVLQRDPDRAETALDLAERVGRESLDGIREVVGLLRSGDEPSSPSVDLAGLVATYRAAGVEVVMTTGPDVASLPLLVQSLVYRVVREALANAARYHRAGTPVTVATRLQGGEVVVAVANDVAAGRRPGGGGYGLTGLREQVGAVGGVLDGGPAEGRWRVTCRLPLRASTATGSAAP